jgi:hypothetical protein
MNPVNVKLPMLTAWALVPDCGAAGSTLARAAPDAHSCRTLAVE